VKPQKALAYLGFPFFIGSIFSLFLSINPGFNPSTMLTGNFFDIQSFTLDESETGPLKYHVIVNLNNGNPIYEGHFPGNPIVPGVCQIQMVLELIEKAVNLKLKLTEADNIKFLSMINPLINSQLEFDITIKDRNNQQITASASIGSGSSIFLKFKGKFEIAG
jgi:3-hydroxyacyl-[acyl-carrier-protein] dehydratase